MTAAETLTVASRFALTLDGLCRAVAARIALGAVTAAMIVLIWRRLRRIDGLIQALLARFRAGRLWVRTESRLGAGGGRRVAASRGLPVGFGWLLPVVPHEAACFAGQMRGVLAEPEMVALLAASPQARRVLAPLCRMLGIEAWVLAPAGVMRPGPGSDLDLGVEAPPLAERRAVDFLGHSHVADPQGVTVLPMTRRRRSSGRRRRGSIGVGVEQQA